MAHSTRFFGVEWANQTDGDQQVGRNPSECLRHAFSVDEPCTKRQRPTESARALPVPGSDATTTTSGCQACQATAQKQQGRRLRNGRRQGVVVMTHRLEPTARGLTEIERRCVRRLLSRCRRDQRVERRLRRNRHPRLRAQVQRTRRCHTREAEPRTEKQNRLESHRGLLATLHALQMLLCPELKRKRSAAFRWCLNRRLSPSCSTPVNPSLRSIPDSGLA